MENLTGGVSDQKFVFSNGAGVSGVVDGAGGTDTLDYSANQASVQVDLSAKTATGTAGVLNFGNVPGGNGDNILVGNHLHNILRGNGGADNLTRLAGNDILVGGAAGYTLDGGDGLDWFWAKTANPNKDNVVLMEPADRQLTSRSPSSPAQHEGPPSGGPHAFQNSERRTDCFQVLCDIYAPGRTWVQS